LPLKELVEQVAVKVYTRTLSKTIKFMEFCNCIATKKPYLNP
jgi:hypothetical protein